MAEPIQFGSSQKSGYSDLAGASPIAMNVYTDGMGVVRRRPGIAAYGEAPSGVVNSNGISGLFAMDDGKMLAVSGGARRLLYEIGGGGKRQLTQPLLGQGRPTFAQTEMLVVVAGGSKMTKYERSGGATALLGGDPPEASHIVSMNLRLIANDAVIDKTKIRYSDVSQGTLAYTGHETWTPTTPPTAGYFTAESKPDPIVAVGVNTNEIFVWGTNSVQLFAPDPTFIFAPTATHEYGCIAPMSVVQVDQQFFWLDQYRRIIMSDGRSRDDVSGDIGATLETIERVDDCFAYRVLLGNVDAVCFCFPTDGRTFAFQRGSGWAQWSGFGTNWERFKVNAHCYRSQDGANVVGTTDGFIGQLDQSASSDLGSPINAYAVTGYIDRGTDMRKHCQVVRLALRRGKVTGTRGPVAFLCWRDRPGPWQGRVPVDLGRSNDTDPVVELRSLGVYRRRQWMFEFNGTEDLALVRASEEFEVSDQ